MSRASPVEILNTSDPPVIINEIKDDVPVPIPIYAESGQPRSPGFIDIPNPIYHDLSHTPSDKQRSSIISPTPQTQIKPIDKMEMNPSPPPSLCRSSMILNVLLITGIVLGIILCACIPADSNLLYLGPAFLGLSAFAFCGKMFFTLFWEEDPVPMLNPYLERINTYVGPVKDPYGLQKSSAYSNAAYTGPYGGGGGMEMVPPTYYSIQPKMYDESIDTTPRTYSS